MESLNTEISKAGPKASKEEYNNIPVMYCEHCLSLAIRSSDNMDYCDKCGGTDIKEAHISEYEKMYEQRYGENYLTGK